MPKYKLGANFWTGTRAMKRGEVAEFEEGKQPRRATKVEEPKPAPKPKPVAKSEDE